MKNKIRIAKALKKPSLAKCESCLSEHKHDLCNPCYLTKIRSIDEDTAHDDNLILGKRMDW